MSGLSAIPSVAVLLLALPFAGCGPDARRAEGPAPEQIWCAVLLESEMCRRMVPTEAPVFSGPARLRDQGGNARDGWRVGFTVRIHPGGAGEDTVPLVGEILFRRDSKSWRVDERHWRAWRRAGLVPTDWADFSP
jgi:hypothetical protein